MMLADEGSAQLAHYTGPSLEADSSPHKPKATTAATKDLSSRAVLSHTEHDDSSASHPGIFLNALLDKSSVAPPAHNFPIEDAPSLPASASKNSCMIKHTAVDQIQLDAMSCPHQHHLQYAAPRSAAGSGGAATGHSNGKPGGQRPGGANALTRLGATTGGGLDELSTAVQVSYPGAQREVGEVKVPKEQQAHAGAGRQHDKGAYRQHDIGEGATRSTSTPGASGSRSGSSVLPPPVTPVAAPVPLPLPSGMPPISKRRKHSKLRRAWMRLKRAATCANVNTFDTPLHGTPLEGEEVQVIRPVAAGGPDTYDAILTADLVQDLTALEQQQLKQKQPQQPQPQQPEPEPRQSSSGSERHHTGYLTTPEQLSRDYRNAPQLPFSDAYVSSAAETVGSSVRAPELSGAYGTYGEWYEHGSSRKSLMTKGAAEDEGGDGGGGREKGRGQGSAGAAAAGTDIRTGGGGCVLVKDEAEGLDEANVRRAHDSLYSSIGSAEDWHDARSFASTFSVSSILLSAPSRGTTPTSPRANIAGHPAPHAPSAATTGAPPGGVEQLDVGTQKGWEAGRGYRMDMGWDNSPRAKLPPAAQDSLQVLHPATPPLARKPPTAAPANPLKLPPPPPPQPQYTPSWTADENLTGHFSTPVLSAPQRTSSIPISQHTPSTTPASAGLTAGVMNISDRGLGQATNRRESSGSGGGIEGDRVEEVAVTPPRGSQTAVTTPRMAVVPSDGGAGGGGGVVPTLAGLPGGPKWAPEKVFPGMEATMRFVPVPLNTGLSGYWAKIPELSAKSPMPLDVALNSSRMARSVHESIKGILFRETDKDLSIKARVTLPLGIRITHEEHYHKDHSPYYSMLRRDIRPGRSVMRLFYTETGEVLLVCDSLDLSGRVDHSTFELIRIIEDGQTIQCRQWVWIAHTGKMAEQYFIGRRSEIPG